MSSHDMAGVDPTPDPKADGFEIDRRLPVAVRSPAAIAKEAAVALPQLVAMVYRLLRDPVVPKRRKMLAGVALGYVISPIDFVPDFIPVFGKMDDLIMVALAVHLLIESVPDEIKAAYWDGSEDALELVRGLLGWGADLVPEPLRRYVR